MSANKAASILLAASIGTACAYFAASLFTFFYTGRVSFAVLSAAVSFGFVFFARFLSDEVVTRLRANWRAEIVGILVLFLAGGFTFATLRLCLQFPTLFERRVLFMDLSSLPLFLALGAVSSAASLFVFSILQKRGALERVRRSRFGAFLRENLGGLVLTAFFFLAYFSLAETVNFPGFFTVDQYFELDISTWIERLTAPTPQDIPDRIRAVHPALMLILRPPIWFLSLFLKGDRLHALFLLHAIAASACVFLAWQIVKRAAPGSSLALIAASLLGASASHLLLGSMIDTYIYTALALLLFVSILQNEPVPLKFTVLAGVVVFGITVTNIVQTAALYFIKQPRFKTILQYGALVLGITLALNFVQTRVYPTAMALAPSNLGREQRFQSDLFENRWRLAGRVSLTARAVLMYGIVAPTPFILTDELGMTIPNFRTFAIAPGEFRVAGYDGLGDLAAKAWMALLAAALLLFVLEWREKSKPALSLGLLACLAFNFLLHVLYGDDPLLYSPDWAYALVLFAAFSFRRFANRTWLQIPLAAFLVPLMIVNLGLIRQIMEVSAPFYGR